MNLCISPAYQEAREKQAEKGCQAYFDVVRENTNYPFFSHKTTNVPWQKNSRACCRGSRPVGRFTSEPCLSEYLSTMFSLLGSFEEIWHQISHDHTFLRLVNRFEVFSFCLEI